MRGWAAQGCFGEISAGEGSAEGYQVTHKWGKVCGVSQTQARQSVFGDQHCYPAATPQPIAAGLRSGTACPNPLGGRDGKPMLKPAAKRAIAMDPSQPGQSWPGGGFNHNDAPAACTGAQDISIGYKRHATMPTQAASLPTPVRMVDAGER